MKRSDYLDHIVLDTLNHLSNVTDGLRYTELKTRLNVSDASMVNRLNKLKDAGYVTVVAKTKDTGRHYVSYSLTHPGIELVHVLDVPSLLKKVENQLTT